MILNNFCVLPFNSISISADGKIRQCCNSGGVGFETYIKDSPVENFINNEDLISLRDNFIKDEKDIRCNRCWDIEKVGNDSFRHWANNEEYFGLKSIIPIRKEKILEFKDLQYLDITLGNKCNLACRMCNPTSSSLIAKQLIKVNKWDGGESIDFSRESKDKILDLINRAENLNTLYLLGGEPLINEFHDEIVDLLIKTGRAKNIRIHYNTNLQIDLEKYLSLWENFKQILCSISIDGTDSTYEYIRWPGRWNKLYNNLLRASEFQKDHANFFPSISTTVQNLNGSNMYDIIDKCSMSSNTGLGFYFFPVTGIPNLGTHHLHLLPTYVLETELQKIKGIPEPWNRYTVSLIKYYEDAIEKSKNINSKELTMFFETQKMYDSLRNQNLFETFPYFEELANKFNIEPWQKNLD